MSTADDISAISSLTERLERQFADRSGVEIVTAVVDAWDHSTAIAAPVDLGQVERSALVRLSVPTAGI